MLGEAWDCELAEAKRGCAKRGVRCQETCLQARIWQGLVKST